ncbi:MAG TPA: acyltransferase domain-containing protein [Acidimicrobiales bacterium]
MPGLGWWLDELARLGPPPEPLALPGPAAAADLLARTGVPGGEIPAIVATLPSPGTDPDRWWVLERAYHRLTAGLAGAGDDPAEVAPAPDGRGPWGVWPALPASLGPGWEWFHVHLHLAALPGVLRRHAALGIDPAVTWATLGNLGRNVAIHRAMHGGPGLHAPWWLVLHVRGALFEVGRLQYRRARAGWSVAGAPFAVGDPVLDLHIPPTGPLAPVAVDASFLAARALFARHFPADDSPAGVCASWLLDPQLRVYLPDDANILRFQQRFQLDDGWSLPADDTIVEFVFRHTGTPLDALPRHTTLERAVVDHLRDGGHWETRRGWCAVPPRPLA